MGGANSLVGVDALAAELAGPRPPRLLDVRWPVPWPAGHVTAGPGPADPAAYRAGHLPGAVFVDLDADLAAPPAGGSRGRHPLPDAHAFTAAMRRLGVGAGPVVVYDDGPGFAAARAWWCLRFFGHEDVRVLDGGIAAWRAAGRSTETGEAPLPPPGDFTADPGHLPMLDARGAAAQARLGLLLDARVAERYRGESAADPVRGHIPGAVSAPTFDSVGADGQWHPPTFLRTRFAILGAEGEEVGVYCGSGVTAAHAALAMTVAGLPTPAVYVGSWSEWIADAARPVAIGSARG
ncbi:sulfurtransferase [Sporichthya brevicatena]|uniref:Sulfurtransferase n=1 Tax=Sporichthya brevicatena TaxID=171442 RepID=A0ABP3S5U4_9ACTN